MNSQRDFFKDLIKYIPSFVIPSFFSILSFPIFTHFIKPAEWAVFTLGINATDFMITISVSWISTSINRYVAKEINEGTYKSFFTTVFLLTISIVTISTISLGLILFYFRNSITYENIYSLVFPGLMLFYVRALSEVSAGLFRANRKADIYSGLISVQNIARFTISLILITLFRQGANALFYGYAGGVLLSLLIFSKHTPISEIKISLFSWRKVGKFLRYGLPIIGGNIAYWLLRISDRYIMAAFRSPTEVGIYAVGFDISDRTLMMLVLILTLSSNPLVMQTWEKKGIEATSNFVSQLMKIYIIICLPAMVGLFILGRQVMSVLADPEYIEGYKIIPFVVLSTFLFGFQSLYQMGLAIYERTSRVWISALFGCVVNISLNFLLVPKYGYYAAAINNVLGYGTFTLLIVLFSRKEFSWKFPFVTLIRVLLASIAMTIPVFLGRNLHFSALLELIVFIPICILAYFIVLFFLGEIPKTKIKNLMTVFQ